MEVYEFKIKRISRMQRLLNRVGYKFRKLKHELVVRGRVFTQLVKGEDFYYFGYKTKYLYRITPEAFLSRIVKDCGETAWINIDGMVQECERF